MASSVEVPIIGRKIVEIRTLTKEEIAREGWDGMMGHQDPAVLVLDNGTILYPAQDSEGNGPGCLYGRLGKKSFYVFGRDRSATAPHEADVAKS